MTNINETFKSRGTTHGLYEQQSKLTMCLIELLEDAARTNATKMSFTQRHSLYLICVKLGRIATGSADEVDHWHDIAGYATLIERELNGKDLVTGE